MKRAAANRKSKRGQRIYVAGLIFQFRAHYQGKDNTIRDCERRLIHVRARSAREALRIAKRIGKSDELVMHSELGNPIYVEFVGIYDLLELGKLGEFDPQEVWYDIIKVKKPMERRKLLLPPESQLSAIFHERGSKRQNKRVVRSRRTRRTR